jgi:hypothetical protein
VDETGLKRSIRWYVADTWAEQHGVLGALLFVDGFVVLRKFGFQTIELACAWADGQKIPVCEHDWKPSAFRQGTLATVRLCRRCKRRERRHCKDGRVGKWRLTLPSAHGAELPR